MGLDIKAGSKIVFIEAYNNSEVFEDKYYTYDPGKPCPYVNLYPERVFRNRHKPLKFDGKEFACYRIDGETFEFRAGSYGGYNDWREWLSRMANGLTPREIWQQRDKRKIRALPFYPLIDFSDCRGTLGSIVAARLANDFASHRERAERVGDAWQVAKYHKWHKACVLAADDGFIKFT